MRVVKRTCEKRKQDSIISGTSFSCPQNLTQSGLGSVIDMKLKNVHRKFAVHENFLCASSKYLRSECKNAAK